MTKRDWHWTDVPLEGRNRRRTIGTYLNYKTRDGGWHECSPRLRNAEPGDDFFGMDLRKVGDHGALDFFVGNQDALGGRPWWGVRRSDIEIDRGVVFFIENGVDAGQMQVQEGRREVLWQEVLPDTDLYLYTNTHYLEKWLALNTPTAGEGGTGNRVDIGIIIPDNWTLEVLEDATPGNYFRILNGQGVEKYRSKPARAVDSSATPQEVPCQFNKLAKGTLNGVEYYRIRVRCFPNGFTYPILMDPTTTISGTTDIEDNCLISASNNNYGGGNSCYFKNTATKETGLMRLATSAIPEGTYSALRLYFWALSDTRTFDRTVAFYQVAQANTWVEGTKTGATETGSSCWNKLAYNTTNWAGSAGCATSGTDYTADASPPTCTWVRQVNGANTATLKASWLSDWKTGGFVNNGFVVPCVDITNLESYWGTTEHATSGSRPYFEIDYAEPIYGWANPLDVPVRQLPVETLAFSPFTPYTKKKVP